MLEVAAAEATVGTFLLLRELPNTAQVGVGGDAVVGDAQGHPYGAFASGTFAHHLHDPRLVGVADGDALAGGVVAVAFHQFGHAADGLAGRRGALKGQAHEAEVVEQAVGVLQFQASVKGALYDGHLPFVHESHHVISIFHLFDKLVVVRGTPAVDGYLLAGGVAPGGGVEEGAREAEAVAVVGADDAPVGGGFLAHNQVGAGLGLKDGGHGGQQYQKGLFHLLFLRVYCCFTISYEFLTSSRINPSSAASGRMPIQWPGLIL